MTLGLSIDPGMSNGACLFSYDGITGFRAEKVWQFPNGCEGLRRWLAMEGIALDPRGLLLHRGLRLDTLVVEKFTPRQNEGFNLTQDDVEPLRGEGVLIGAGLGHLIQWREPIQQYFMGGDTKAERKRRARVFLAQHDMLWTGTQIEPQAPDADDAISATLHAIGYLRSIKHMPTLMQYFPPKGI